jgi:tetratricopeptide (TPR) repeat protein
MDIDAVKSKKHLSKAIELDPNFASAYANLGNLILKKLDAVQEEMDATGMNFDKADRIRAEKMLPILNESLPFLEKAYELQPSDGGKIQLNSLYENLNMEKHIE